jgi:hypothetical protein
MNDRFYDEARELLKPHGLEENYPLCVEIAESLEGAHKNALEGLMGYGKLKGDDMISGWTVLEAIDALSQERTQHHE